MYMYSILVPDPKKSESSPDAATIPFMKSASKLGQRKRTQSVADCSYPLLLSQDAATEVQNISLLLLAPEGTLKPAIEHDRVFEARNKDFSPQSQIG
ncbi:hypothetical protein HK100_004803 [Physocladia obscura]|uniref:Uncharacterized protein n=1 Tax=Physocladia obscura TaxID=109957 RepID=A0AAD5X8I9_9FUNG|nr:hypothetical protein HK100_004803 [Physocladia obscura]